MAQKNLSDYPWMKLHFSQFLMDCMGKNYHEIGEMMMDTIKSWTNDDYNSLPNFAKIAADERFLKTKIYKSNRDKNTTHCGDETTIDNNCETIDNNCEQLPIFSSLLSSSLSLSLEDTLKDKDTLEGTLPKKDNDTLKDTNKNLFNDFRIKYPGTKRGLDTEYDNFIKKHPKYREIIPMLIPAIEKQIEARNKLFQAKKWVPEWKNLQTWINNKCWEEEIAIPEENRELSIEEALTRF